ncbi:MAG: type II toxin-antitoxin system PemK/MazF family toxin [Spartobacteria bacterium]
MQPGDVVLAALLQADGKIKLRPTIVLARIKPFGDVLLCGVSSQLQNEVRGFDEVLSQDGEDFLHSGLSQASLIRLGYLATYPKSRVAGVLGSISPQRLVRLREKLAAFLILP